MLNQNNFPYVSLSSCVMDHSVASARRPIYVLSSSRPLRPNSTQLLGLPPANRDQKGSGRGAPVRLIDYASRPCACWLHGRSLILSEEGLILGANVFPCNRTDDPLQSPVSVVLRMTGTVLYYGSSSLRPNAPFVGVLGFNSIVFPLSDIDR
jgi:hypothetical protein